MSRSPSRAAGLAEVVPVAEAELVAELALAVVRAAAATKPSVDEGNSGRGQPRPAFFLLREQFFQLRT